MILMVLALAASILTLSAATTTAESALGAALCLFVIGSIINAIRERLWPMVALAMVTAVVLAAASVILAENVSDIFVGGLVGLTAMLAGVHLWRLNSRTRGRA